MKFLKNSCSVLRSGQLVVPNLFDEKWKIPSGGKSDSWCEVFNFFLLRGWHFAPNCMCSNVSMKMNYTTDQRGNILWGGGGGIRLNCSAWAELLGQDSAKATEWSVFLFPSKFWKFPLIRKYDKLWSESEELALIRGKFRGDRRRLTYFFHKLYELK